jgi:hypothetical protein
MQQQHDHQQNHPRPVHARLEVPDEREQEKEDSDCYTDA